MLTAVPRMLSHAYHYMGNFTSLKVATVTILQNEMYDSNTNIHCNTIVVTKQKLPTVIIIASPSSHLQQFKRSAPFSHVTNRGLAPFPSLFLFHPNASAICVYAKPTWRPMCFISHLDILSLYRLHTFTFVLLTLSQAHSFPSPASPPTHLHICSFLSLIHLPGFLAAA